MSDVEMYGLKITPMPKSFKPKMVRIKRNKKREEAYRKVIEVCIKASKWKVPSFVNSLHDKNEDV